MAAVTGPDGRTLLATGSTDRTVRLWDPTIGQPASQPLTGHTGRVTAMAAVTGPDGRTLLATSNIDRIVRLWDPMTRQPASQPLTGHTGRVTAVTAVTGPGGRTLLATGSTDQTLRVWDPAAGTCLATLTLHLLVVALSTVSDTHIAVGTDEGIAVLDLTEVLRH
jgi:WD40 repeat protein